MVVIGSSAGFAETVQTAFNLACSRAEVAMIRPTGLIDRRFLAAAPNFPSPMHASKTILSVLSCD